MKRIALLTLVLAALLASGTAKAGWCGEADAACDLALAYVECADGTIWVVDPALADADTFGDAVCGGSYTLLRPPVEQPPPSPSPPEGPGPFDLDPRIDPDPALYVGEVTCPDGRVWAVAVGDDFACPVV